MINDPVGEGTAGAVQIGFVKADHANCSEVLWQNLVRNPDKVALIGPAGKLTYAELVGEAARWGNAFTAAGLQRSERIVFFLDDTFTYPSAFFGAVRAGLVPVLVNIQTKQDLLKYYLSDSEARFAVVEAESVKAFDSATRKDTQLECTIVVNGNINEDGFINADRFLEGQANELSAANTDPDDMAFWMYSSGSTGRPKGIVHLHHDIAYTDLSYGQKILALNPDDICFSVPKIYFAYGFGNSITFPFSVGATSLLLPGPPKPDAILDAIEFFRPTVFFGLPTLYTALVGAESIKDRDLSSLRQSISAAEILSEDIYSSWKQLAGHGPTEGLGSTELLHIYLSNSLEDHRIGAAGAPVPGYEVRLVSPSGAPVRSEENGVMMVRGHSSAPFYWNRPDKTAETMQEDWINTGDRFIEKEGYYYFQGRADDLIKISGQWVWPMEVERCINEHEDVHECAVLAVQLADKRMVLKAVVSLKSNGTKNDNQTQILRDYVKLKLTPYKSPRHFEYVDDLPKTGTGKIDRQRLATTFGSI